MEHALQGARTLGGRVRAAGWLPALLKTLDSTDQQGRAAGVVVLAAALHAAAEAQSQQQPGNGTTMAIGRQAMALHAETALQQQSPTGAGAVNKREADALHAPAKACTTHRPPANGSETDSGTEAGAAGLPGSAAHAAAQAAEAAERLHQCPAAPTAAAATAAADTSVATGLPAHTPRAAAEDGLQQRPADDAASASQMDFTAATSAPEMSAGIQKSSLWEAAADALLELSAGPLAVPLRPHLLSAINSVVTLSGLDGPSGRSRLCAN